MSEERLNPNFNINEKYETMSEQAKSIVEDYLSHADKTCEAPNYISLAYDVKNYLPKLQQENQQLKEKINTYENPEDLTLMFMYCDEQAKDKIKELKEIEKEHQKINGELREENKKLKQWNCNKDTRNSRQRIANDKLQKQNKQLKEVIEEVREEIYEYKKIVENGIEQGAYYSYIGSLQQRLDKLLQILDKGVKDE